MARTRTRTRPSMSEEERAHYANVMRAMTEGRVVPLLGAGVNLASRPRGRAWKQGQYLPNGYELAKYLASSFSLPDDTDLNLLRVSQYVVTTEGLGPLYDELRKLFDAELPADARPRVLRHAPGAAPQARHAPVPGDPDHELRRRARAGVRRREGALRRHLVHRRRRTTRGKFWHRPPGARAEVIERPNDVRRAGDRRADGDPQDPRRGRPGGLRPRQLRDHRGPLHRLPDQDGDRPAGPRRAAREAEPEPVPLPRLQHAGLEPAGDPAPDLGPAATLVQVVGDPEGAGASSTASSGRSATSTCSISRSTTYVEGLVDESRSAPNGSGTPQ